MALLLAFVYQVHTHVQIGGTVAGLTGTGLVLHEHGADDLAISANGAFAFSRQLKKDARYSVRCSSSLRARPARSATVRARSRRRSPAWRSLRQQWVYRGRNGSGLTGAGLVLQNNGGNNLPIAADAPSPSPRP